MILKTKKKGKVSIRLVTSGVEHKSSGDSIMDAFIKLGLKPYEIGGKTFLYQEGLKKPIFIKVGVLRRAILKPSIRPILDKRFSLLCS